MVLSIDIIADDCFVLSQCMRLTDGRTDGRQTDRKATAIAHSNRVRYVLKWNWIKKKVNVKNITQVHCKVRFVVDKVKCNNDDNIQWSFDDNSEFLQHELLQTSNCKLYYF